MTVFIMCTRHKILLA